MNVAEKQSPAALWDRADRLRVYALVAALLALGLVFNLAACAARVFS